MSGIAFANIVNPHDGETMLNNEKFAKKNPLTKAQNKLLKESLKNLLGTGLIARDTQKEEREMKAMVLRNALNAFELNN